MGRHCVWNHRSISHETWHGKVFISLGNYLRVEIDDKFLKLLEIKSQMGSCPPIDFSYLVTAKINPVYQPWSNGNMNVLSKIESNSNLIYTYNPLVVLHYMKIIWYKPRTDQAYFSRYEVLWVSEINKKITKPLTSHRFLPCVEQGTKLRGYNHYTLSSFTTAPKKGETSAPRRQRPGPSPAAQTRALISLRHAGNRLWLRPRLGSGWRAQSTCLPLLDWEFFLGNDKRRSPSVAFPTQWATAGDSSFPARRVILPGTDSHEDSVVGFTLTCRASCDYLCWGAEEGNWLKQRDLKWLQIGGQNVS